MLTRHNMLEYQPFDEVAIMQNLIKTLWHLQKDQEALLDLGERKAWGDDALDEAINEWVGWLNAHDLGPGAVTRTDRATPSISRPRIWYEAARWVLPPGEGARSRSEENKHWGHLLGCSPRSFDNELSKDFKPTHAAHMWVHQLANIDTIALDSLLYHRRTRANMAAFWERLLSGDHIPALADRLVLISLAMLYQRRRPTEAARGNRGRTAPRRSTPKPAKRPTKELVSQGFADTMCGWLQHHRDAPRTASVAALLVELLLTQRHAHAHTDRTTEPSGVSERSSWEDARIPSLVGLAPDDDRVVFEERLRIMHCYERREPYTGGSSDEHPYLHASAIIQHLREQEQTLKRGARIDWAQATDDVRELERLYAEDAPGLVMLGSQITSWRDKLDHHTPAQEHTP